MRNPRLKVNQYYTDPEQPHIVIREDPDPEIFVLVQRTCPASLYYKDSEGYHYDYTGCLECGSCLIIGGDSIFAAWNYPRNGYGIDYGEDPDK